MLNPSLQSESFEPQQTQEPVQAATLRTQLEDADAALQSLRELIKRGGISPGEQAKRSAELFDTMDRINKQLDLLEKPAANEPLFEK